MPSSWLQLNLRRWRTIAMILGLLLASALAGFHPRMLSLLLPIILVGAFILVQRPVLGLALLIVAALVMRVEFGTGTDVALNPVALLMPALLALGLGDSLWRRAKPPTSRVNKPLIFFVLAGLLSMVVGNALWDPAVLRPGNMTVVQLGQWAIFFFSAGAFWLMASLACEEIWLRRLTWLFLALAGTLAIGRVIPGLDSVIRRVATFAVDRSPFWMLLGAIAGSQLIFNAEIKGWKRIYLLCVLVAVFDYVFVLERKTASNWIGVAAVAGALLWVRFPRLRVATLVLIVLLSPIIWREVYQFAGGEGEWEESGGSRLALISRVLEVTMRNPITGLGPASYRPYAGMKPLQYGQAFYTHPLINSHNNYVDLFAHVGLLGLGLLFWFFGELGALAWRLSQSVVGGFGRSYTVGMLAALVGSIALMLFADWILPFVYNIGFSGFQASILIWLFLGGLVSIEQHVRAEGAT